MVRFRTSTHLIGRRNYMAKALIGHLSSDLRDPRLAADNARLRSRVAELEQLVLRLSAENDRLVAARAAELLDGAQDDYDDVSELSEMQPA